MPEGERAFREWFSRVVEAERLISAHRSALARSQPRDSRGRFARRLQSIETTANGWVDSRLARPIRTVGVETGRANIIHHDRCISSDEPARVEVSPETEITLTVFNRNFDTLEHTMARGAVHHWLNERYRNSSRFARAVVRETDETYRPCQRCHEITQTDADLCQACGEIYACCLWCRDYHERNTMHRDYHNHWVCSACHDSLFICEECGFWRHNEDESEEECICQECYHGGGQYVYSYHSARQTIFLPNADSNLYFGIELETDNYTDIRQASQDLYTLSESDRLFWQEQDGSLEHGIEIITQPCTLDYHLNSFPWQKITEIVTRHGGRSEDTSAAAMHIHFSLSFYDDNQKEYQLRLIYLFERFRSELLVLGRTSDYLAKRSARPYNQQQSHKQWFTDGRLHRRDIKTIFKAIYDYYDRYRAINVMSSQPTNEVRLFRGTLDVNVLKASTELVDFLVRLAKKTSLVKLQTLQWKNLVHLITTSNYQYLPAYLTAKTAENPNVLEAE